MTTSQFKITGGKGVHFTFPNGWTASIQFGAGNYCDNRNSPFGIVPTYLASSNAEVACWGPGGEMIDLMDTGDTVIGWQTTTDVLAFLNKVASQP